MFFDSNKLLKISFQTRKWRSKYLDIFSSLNFKFIKFWPSYINKFPENFPGRPCFVKFPRNLFIKSWVVLISETPTLGGSPTHYLPIDFWDHLLGLSSLIINEWMSTFYANCLQIYFSSRSVPSFQYILPQHYITYLQCTLVKNQNSVNILWLWAAQCGQPMWCPYLRGHSLKRIFRLVCVQESSINHVVKFLDILTPTPPPSWSLLCTYDKIVIWLPPQLTTRFMDVPLRIYL